MEEGSVQPVAYGRTRGINNSNSL